MNINELRDGLAYVSAELRSIHETAGDDVLDAEAQTRFDEGTAYVTATGSTISGYEVRLAAVGRLAENPAHIERGAPHNEERTVPNVNRNRDPFAGDVRNADAQELRDRAMSAVMDHSNYGGVTDEKRAAAAKLVDRFKPGSDAARDVQRHILATGSPEYARAFDDYMSAPSFGPGPELRAAMAIATDAAGGVLIPQWLDPTINLTNGGTNNVIRQLADVIPITSNIWEGVTSAGVNAAMLAEGVEVGDNTPVFEAPTITVHKAAAYMFASYEALADTGFDQVGELFAEAKDRLEETQFTTGSGTAAPRGLISALSGTGPSVAGSSGAAGAADFVIGDVYAVKNALTPRFRKNAQWMANPVVLDRVRQFGNSAAGSNAANFWVDLGAAVPSTLLGKGAYENEAMDGTIVSGSSDDILLFGDFKQYKIIDRVGMSIMYNPLIVSTGNGRPTGQAGWFGFWRIGADVITSAGFKLLRV